MAKSTARRSFGGKLDGFTDKTDRAFNQRMLRAYLKEQERFRFGFRDEKNAVGIMMRVPAYYPVLQKRSA